VTPVVQATLGFAAGILAGANRAALPGGPLLFSLLLIAVAAAMLLRWDATLRPAATAASTNATTALVAGFALLGLGAGFGAARRAAEDCVAGLPADAVVQAWGVLEAVPADGAGVVLRTERMFVHGATLSCTTSLRIRLGAGLATAQPGSPILVRGRWRPYRAVDRWPVRPERRGALSVDSIAPATETVASAPRLLRMRLASQERARRLFPHDWPLAEALILARKEGLPTATRERFIAAGLAHLLAISGTHVALFAGALLLLCRIVRLPQRAGYTAAAAGTVAYVLFLGAPHAAARAALQLLVFLGTRLAQRPVEPISAVALAALLLLVNDPLAVLDPGFHLSFAGVLGIVRLRRPIIEAIPGVLPRWLRDALATGIAASAATTPIAGLHFQQISWISVLSGVAAIPVLACAVPALAMTLLLQPVAPPAAAFLASGTALLLRALDGLAATAAAVPGAHGPVNPPSIVAAVGAALVFVLMRRRSARGGGSGARSLPIREAAIAAAVALLGPPLAFRVTARDLHIYALDVGQGDALAIRTPGNRWILVDAGPASLEYDAGARVVVPFLRRSGVRRIDVLVLSHPHADHIGGARAVLDALDVRLVIDPGGPYGQRLYLSAIEAARRGGSAWLTARPGLVVRVDAVELEFLFPDEAVLDVVTDPNDYSAVFRLGYGRFGALFFGDAPMAVENAVLRASDGTLDAQLVKIGHHGSRTSTGDSLLAVVAPEYAIISAGRRNRYGHPSPEVMSRLERYGVRTLRTDSAGTVRLSVTPRGAIRERANR
jgi:competence protein ComEC